MLGHSTIAITLDLYSHVTPTMQREAAAVLDAIIRRWHRQLECPRSSRAIESNETA
jgi:hypothetical protein